MKEYRIYLVLMALVIWIFGAAYWITKRMCPCNELENSDLSKNIKTQDMDSIQRLESDDLCLTPYCKLLD